MTIQCLELRRLILRKLGCKDFRYDVLEAGGSWKREGTYIHEFGEVSTSSSSSFCESMRPSRIMPAYLVSYRGV